MYFPRTFLAICMVMLVGVFALGGCDEVDSEAGAIKPPAYSIALPRRIQLRALPGDCADNISGSIQIDDEAPVAMERQGASLTWSVTLRSLPLGRHRFEVTFSCTSPAYGAVTLARAEQQVDLVAGANNISFPESLFVFDDLDGDGVANLKEIENGTNPLPSSDIDANPAIAAVLPADGSRGLEPDTTIALRFAVPVREDTIREESFYISAAGEWVEGEIDFDPATNTARFSAKNGLALLTEYTVTATTAIENKNGAPLFSENLRWGFITRSGRWSTPFNLGLNSKEREPVLATDGKGNAIVAWEDRTDKVGIRSYYFDSATDDWDELPFIDSLGVVVKRIRLAMGEGAPVMIWESFDSKRTELYAIHYSSYRDAWDTSPRKIAGFDWGVVSGNSSGVVMDSNGAQTIIWIDIEDWRAPQKARRVKSVRWYSYRGWGDGQFLENSTLSTSSFPDIAVNTKGDVWVAWFLGKSILANRFNGASNSWEDAQVVSRGDTLDGKNSALDIDVDAQGNAVVAWVQENELWVSRFSVVSGAWSEKQNLGAADGNSDGEKRVSPFVFMDRSGNAKVIWKGVDRNFRVAAYSAFRDTWVKSSLLRVGNENVSIGTDRKGNLFAVWLGVEGGRSGIWFSHLYPRITSEWSTPRFIGEKSKGDLGTSLAISSSGEVFLSWTSEARSYVARYH